MALDWFHFDLDPLSGYDRLQTWLDDALEDDQRNDLALEKTDTLTEGPACPSPTSPRR